MKYVPHFAFYHSLWWFLWEISLSSLDTCYLWFFLFIVKLPVNQIKNKFCQILAANFFDKNPANNNNINISCNFPQYNCYTTVTLLNGKLQLIIMLLVFVGKIPNLMKILLYSMSTNWWQVYNKICWRNIRTNCPQMQSLLIANWRQKLIKIKTDRKHYSVFLLPICCLVYNWHLECHKSGFHFLRL